MGKIDVVVYGGVNIGMGSGCSCGCANCGGVKNVEAEYDHMVAMMRQKYAPEEVSFAFINTEGKSLSVYPDVEKVIMNGYSFPITVINDTPYLAGAVDGDAIEEIIGEINGSVGGCGCSCAGCSGC